MANQLNLDKICIICLQENTGMISIFDYDEPQLTILEKIEKCFPRFEILQKQGMYENSAAPNKICKMCLQDLSFAFRFHNNCETTVLLFRCSQAKDETENNTIQHNRDEESPSFNKLHDKQDDSSNTQVDDPEAEYTDYSALEHLDYTYEEEHLDDVGETICEPLEDDGPIEKSETESSTLDNEAQSQLTRTETLSPIERSTTKHVKKHLNYKPHKKYKEKGVHSPKICEICGNTYKYQHALVSHMRRHMNEKPFSCECCNKAFVSNVELRRHMRVHTGDKPYGCNYCDRRFSDYGSRIKHERTHTGERPFVCLTCNKSFAYAHVLSVHLRTHTGEKKFQCSQCSKGFTKKSYMLAHLDQHRRSALLVMKEEEESRDIYSQQAKQVLSNSLDQSETSMEECITTYIVEEVENETNQLKVLHDIDETEESLQDMGYKLHGSLLGTG